MEWDVAVNEFTEAGILIPSDRMSWTDEDPAEGLKRAGWMPTWSMEERDGPPQKPVSANVFVEEETGHVLIDLMLLGVSSWILCRSRFAYLLFMRDFLGELVDLNQADAGGDFREAIEGFLEETAEVLGEVGDWVSAQLKPPVGRRGQRPAGPQPERVYGPVPRSAASHSK